MHHGVYNELQDWQLTYQAIAMGFGTTRRNTGKVNGACTLLEKRLGRRRLHLACRHHIHELIIVKALEVIIHIHELIIPEALSGPNIKLFQRFSRQWTSFNPQQIEPLFLNDSTISEEDRDNLELLISNQLLEKYQRDD